LAFLNNDFDRYVNEENTEIFDNKIIILKKVKSLKQLKHVEKELVRLNYKEAIIKGFTLKGIQQYIAYKTKIWIEWSCLEYLKKAEEQENKEWYLRLAKDHFSYIGIRNT
jgi:hydroxymethylpyrimidine/phosphomethylpyrimidine kinase